MGLSTSLYSGVAGLINNGNAMQVIGDNIANTNTMGFKAGTFTFQDIMSQYVNSARSGSQVGRGSSMNDVTSIFQQGSFESTNSATDLAVAGNGFFIVSNPNKENSQYYTRAGQFHVDQYGYLVNSASYRVQGWEMVTRAGETQGEIVGSIGDIQISNTSAPVATTNMLASVNLDSREEDPISTKYLFNNWADNQGEMVSNIDYQYSTTINVYDSLGNTHELTIYFDPTNAERQWEFIVTMDPLEDKSGIPKTDPNKGVLMRGLVQFTPQGQIEKIFESEYVTQFSGASNFTLVQGISASSAANPLRQTDLELASLTNSSTYIGGIYLRSGGGGTNTGPLTIVNYNEQSGTITLYEYSGSAIAASMTVVTAATTNADQDIQRYEAELGNLTFYSGGGSGTASVADLNIRRDLLFAIDSNDPSTAIYITSGAYSSMYIVDYDPDTDKIFLASFADSAPAFSGNYTVGGDWYPVTWGTNNLPQVLAYFIPPTGQIDQSTGFDPSAQPIEVNFGAHPTTPDNHLTQWLIEAITSTQFANRSNTLLYDQDGYGAGFLENISVDTEGIISGSYSNGRIVNLNQLALARFNSNIDLYKEGGNLWSETTASGSPITGQPSSNGLGSVASYSLEQSNVDIGTEFVKLITTQRAFQANSRIITTTDDLLNEVISLKR
jgi:flagellar hook protein FlgE